MTCAISIRQISNHRPQIATDPPVSEPKLLLKPSFLAKKIPKSIVVPIDAARIAMVHQPKPIKSLKARRKPSSATPTLRTKLDVNSIPSLHGDV